MFSLINAVNANEYNIIENTTVIDENTQINNNFIETNNNYTLESNTQSIDSLDEYNITENVHIKTLEEPYFKQDIDYINFTIFDDFLKGDNIRLSSADNECHFISQDFVLNHKGLPFVVKLVDNYGNPLINQTVVFTIHGVSYNKITDNDGNAKMNIRLNNGVYTIGFAFKGTSKYKSTSGTRTVSMISGMLNPNLDANVVNKLLWRFNTLKNILKGQ
nr:Ig-like domain-containing protein [Methanobrevibacter smithii]